MITEPIAEELLSNIPTDDPSNPETPSEETPEKKSFFGEIVSFIQLIFIALLIIVPLKYFVMEPFIVSGSSMSPNYSTGDYLIVNKLAGTFSEIERGDVLVFVPPSQRSDSWLKYTGYFDPRTKYIKRVIALPGETIKLEDHKIYLQKENENNFTELDEPYIKNSGTTKESTTTLQHDQYFVLGDNRGNSYDSEEWGPIQKSDIIGSPVLRILPFSNFGIYPAKYDF